MGQAAEAAAASGTDPLYHSHLPAVKTADNISSHILEVGSQQFIIYDLIQITLSSVALLLLLLFFLCERPLLILLHHHHP